MEAQADVYFDNSPVFRLGPDAATLTVDRPCYRAGPPGGPNGQAGAVRHGIARALLEVRSGFQRSCQLQGLLPAGLTRLLIDQFLAHDDGVDGAVLLVELEQDVEEDLVVGLVERVAVHDLDDVADHLLVEHHRGQQAHLRLDRVGRELVELAGDGRVD